MSPTEKILGIGRYGCVRFARIKSSDMVVAEKHMKQNRGNHVQVEATLVIYHTRIIRWHQVDILLYGQDQPFIVVKGKKMMQNAEEILDHNFLYKIFAKLYL